MIRLRIRQGENYFQPRNTRNHTEGTRCEFGTSYFVSSVLPLPIPCHSVLSVVEMQLDLEPFPPQHALPVNIHEWFIHSVVAAKVFNRRSAAWHGSVVVDDAEPAG